MIATGSLIANNNQWNVNLICQPKFKSPKNRSKSFKECKNDINVLEAMKFIMNKIPTTGIHIQY